MEWVIPTLFTAFGVLAMAGNARDALRRIGSRAADYRRVAPAADDRAEARIIVLRDHRHAVRRLEDVLRESRERLTGELARSNLPAARRAEICERLATIHYLEASRPAGGRQLPAASSDDAARAPAREKTSGPTVERRRSQSRNSASAAPIPA